MATRGKLPGADPHSNGLRRRNIGGWLRWGVLQLLAIAAILGIVVVILAGLQLYWWLTRTTVEEVDNLIRQNLSAGATAEEIFAFLDSRDIEHGAVGPVDGTSVLLDAGLHPDTQVIAAMFRGTSTSFFITGDIQVFFILDEERRLKEHMVREVFTGP